MVTISLMISGAVVCWLLVCLWCRRGRLGRRSGAIVVWAVIGVAVVFGERVIGLEPVVIVEAEAARGGTTVVARKLEPAC